MKWHSLALFFISFRLLLLFPLLKTHSVISNTSHSNSYFIEIQCGLARTTATPPKKSLILRRNSDLVYRINHAPMKFSWITKIAFHTQYWNNKILWVIEVLLHFRRNMDVVCLAFLSKRTAAGSYRTYFISEFFHNLIDDCF